MLNVSFSKHRHNGAELCALLCTPLSEMFMLRDQNCSYFEFYIIEVNKSSALELETRRTLNNLRSTVFHHSMRSSTSWKTPSHLYGLACFAVYDWLIMHQTVFKMDILWYVFSFRGQPDFFQAELGQYGNPPAGQTRSWFHLHSETTGKIHLTHHMCKQVFEIPTRHNLWSCSVAEVYVKTRLIITYLT